MADVTLDDVNIHVVVIVTEKAAKPDLKDLFNEDFLNDCYFIWITSYLREVPFALMSLEYEGCCSYVNLLTDDKEEIGSGNPAFLINLVPSGVRQSKDELINRLPNTWRLDGPSNAWLGENILRLGVFEITSFWYPLNWLQWMKRLN